MRLELLMIGKTRRPEMRAVIDDYVNRIRHSCPLEVVEVDSFKPHFGGDAGDSGDAWRGRAQQHGQE